MFLLPTTASKPPITEVVSGDTDRRIRGFYDEHIMAWRKQHAVICWEPTEWEQGRGWFGYHIGYVTFEDYAGRAA